MTDLREQLQTHFGLDDFRPSQREVIEDSLNGLDVLCVMPTGAGKSLCYQLPAVIKKGLTLVISPLISLMEDQVQQLRDEGIPAAMLNSTLTPSMQRQVLQEMEAGFEGLLYVAPERFANVGFSQALARLKVSTLVVDEAHCISQWGHDFRREYSQIGQVRRLIGMPPVIALTATATKDVRSDIVAQLEMRKPSIYITGFDRPNLRYESRKVSDNKHRESELISLLKVETGSAIVYCSSRKAVDEVTALLSSNFKGRPIFAYHGGMDMTARSSNQERFMQTPESICVATNAFGMGINKPDIRFVCHYNIPGTLEAYYQEAGRAGRDGRPSRCTILFQYADRQTQDFFIRNMGRDQQNTNIDLLQARRAKATEKLELLIRYAQTHSCRRKQIMEYFGDVQGVANCRCDVCSPRDRFVQLASDEPVAPIQPMSGDVVTLVRQLLSGIARLNGKFGVGMIAEVLCGADNENTRKWNMPSLSVYGLLKDRKIKVVIAMLHRIMEAGLARQRDPDGVKFRPIVELTISGVQVMKGQQPPPENLADLLPRRSRAVEVERPRTPVMVDASRARASNSAPTESSHSPTTAQHADEAELSTAEKNRFEKLRLLRMKLAQTRGLPAYCICHDSTLKAIARTPPQSVSDFEQIRGMSSVKIKLYAEMMLRELSRAEA